MILATLPFGPMIFSWKLATWTDLPVAWHTRVAVLEEHNALLKLFCVARLLVFEIGHRSRLLWPDGGRGIRPRDASVLVGRAIWP